MLESQLSWLKPFGGLLPCELITTQGKTYREFLYFAYDFPI